MSEKYGFGEHDYNMPPTEDTADEWLDEFADELRGQGCDEDFIECTLAELREGNQVTVVSGPRVVDSTDPEGT